MMQFHVRIKVISDLHFWFQDAVKSNEERIKLESQIEELQKKLSEEATAKKQITLLLLEDRKKMATLYLEEKKRSEDLNHLLREEKSKVKQFDTWTLIGSVGGSLGLFLGFSIYSTITSVQDFFCKQF